MNRKKTAALLMAAALSVPVITPPVYAAETMYSVAAVKATGWQTKNGAKYYYDENGKLVTGFRKIDGKTYYFLASQNGKMATGWVNVNKRKYYFGADGKMRTGKVKLDGITYDFGNNGALKGTVAASLDWKTTKKSLLKNKNAMEIGSMVVVSSGATSAETASTYFFEPDKGTLLIIVDSSVKKTADADMKARLKDLGYKYDSKTTRDGQTAYVYKNGTSYAFLVSDKQQGISFSSVVFMSPAMSLAYDTKGAEGLEEMFEGWIGDLSGFTGDMSGFGGLVQ